MQKNPYQCSGNVQKMLSNVQQVLSHAQKCLSMLRNSPIFDSVICVQCVVCVKVPKQAPQQGEAWGLVKEYLREAYFNCLDRVNLAL